MNHYFTIHSAACPKCQTVHQLSGRAVVQVCRQCHTVFDRQKGLIPFTLHAQYADCCQTLAIGDTFLHHDILYTITGKVVKYEKGDKSAVWTEYYLTHPTEQGIFLNEYGGHWSIVTPFEPVPKPNFGGTTLYIDGFSYQLTHQYDPVFAYAEGNFEFNPFEEADVHSFEYLKDNDLIIIDKDKSKNIANFYRSTYIFHADLRKKLTNKVTLPPKTEDFGINQPFYINLDMELATAVGFAFIALITVTMCVFRFLIAPEVNIAQNLVLITSDTAKIKSFPDRITVPYDNSIINTQLSVDGLSNDWAGAEISLINDKTGEERFYSIETEYYFGSDSDGAWSEGSLVADGNIAHVEKGTYHIEVLPFHQNGSISKELRLNLTNFKGNSGWYLIFLITTIIALAVLFWAQATFDEQRKTYYDLS